jgi:hypothetical protein
MSLHLPQLLELVPKDATTTDRAALRGGHSRLAASSCADQFKKQRKHGAVAATPHDLSPPWP